MVYRHVDISPSTVQQHVSKFLATRLNVLRHVRDALADCQDKQKEQADAKGRGFIYVERSDTKFLFSAKTLPLNVVSDVFKPKLRSRFIIPFTVVAEKGHAYTLNFPRKLRTYPVLYVGLRKPCQKLSYVSLEALATQNLTLSSAAEYESGGQSESLSRCDPT